MTENLLKQKRLATRICRGEMWIAYDKHSKKMRPFLIMSDVLLGFEDDITVVPSTTKNSRNDYDVKLCDWKNAGLNNESVLRCSKIHYVKHILLQRRTGKLKNCDMKQVENTLRKYLAL